jgi:hypothetical protein
MWVIACANLNDIPNPNSFFIAKVVAKKTAPKKVAAKKAAPKKVAKKSAPKKAAAPKKAKKATTTAVAVVKA